MNRQVSCRVFIFWEKIRETKNIFNVIEDIVLDSSKVIPDLEATLVQPPAAQRAQAFIILTVLFNSTKEEQELTYRTRSDIILSNTRNILFRNYYLPLLLWTSKQFNAPTLNKALSFFPCASV
jgi:hypothetical protein